MTSSFTFEYDDNTAIEWNCVNYGCALSPSDNLLEAAGSGRRRRS